jgi:hypothetical protein
MYVIFASKERKTNRFQLSYLRYLQGDSWKDQIINVWSRPKPSLKFRTANAICWNSFGLFSDYGLDDILLVINLKS